MDREVDKFKVIVDIVNHLRFNHLLRDCYYLSEEYAEYLCNMFGNWLVVIEFVTSYPQFFSLYGITVDMTPQSVLYSGKMIYY